MAKNSTKKTQKKKAHSFDGERILETYEKLNKQQQEQKLKPVAAPYVNEHSFDLFMEALRSQAQANLQNSLALSEASRTVSTRSSADLYSRRNGSSE